MKLFGKQEHQENKRNQYMKKTKKNPMANSQENIRRWATVRFPKYDPNFTGNLPIDKLTDDIITTFVPGETTKSVRTFPYKKFWKENFMYYVEDWQRIAKLKLPKTQKLKLWKDNSLAYSNLL